MDDLAIIDRFTETFSRYIDSGFGLLSGDVAFLTSILIAIDITLAGLFWALMGEDNVLAQLIRKVLYIGFFALLLSNFKGLADIDRLSRHYGGEDYRVRDRDRVSCWVEVTHWHGWGQAKTD